MIYGPYVKRIKKCKMKSYPANKYYKIPRQFTTSRKVDDISVTQKML